MYAIRSYYDYLFEKGQCSVRTAPGTELRVMILSVGRRSGKTQLASIIGAYETYKLISKGDPQEYYGLPAGEPVITSYSIHYTKLYELQ